MNFNAPLLRPLRILLFPVSLIYALVVWFRNLLFDRGILKSARFNLPVVCIGNLSAGGTGKSTMVEYLLGQLKAEFETAVLSRGYKRKTRGYAIAGDGSTALEIGDEPMQFHLKYPDVTVAVGEERIVALAQLLHDRPQTRVVLLDDAFQHRSISAGLNIVLTDYSNLYTRDWYLPTGDLRDERRSIRRAEVIVVTKCPEKTSSEEIKSIKDEIGPLPGQSLFFTRLRYGNPRHIITRKEILLQGVKEVLLVTGIANPWPLKKYLGGFAFVYEEMLFGDHHIFNIDDWKEIRKQFSRLQHPSRIILTTEKDAVRLFKFGNELSELPVYSIPVEMQFLSGQEQDFLDLIITFIQKFGNKQPIEDGKKS